MVNFLTNIRMNSNKLSVQYIPVTDLKPSDYNPRKWDKEALSQIKDSLTRYGFVDPLVVNGAEDRKNVVIGGHLRLKVAKEMGMVEVPVVYINLPDLEREKELNLRLNRNLGAFDESLLAAFDESLLKDVGFSSEELDQIFPDVETPEMFDLQKELKKLEITNVEIQKGQVWQLGTHRLMCGDSTVEADILKLMGNEKADMCLTDPPYILDYLSGKRQNDPTTGFGAKKNRRYLETDELPENFTELWMANIKKVAKNDFAIMVYENWKNLRTIWDEMSKHWRVRNMVVWHLSNRHQGYAGKHKFFSKHDIAMVGASGTVPYNLDPEEGALQEEYETALFAISGDPQWESYRKGNRYMPTDFIEFRASDEKHSGQGVIFGTKPLEILIPYLKVLTKRGDLVVEPFGGSGSTLIAAEKLARRCYAMEKSPVYCEVIRKRWENLTGKHAVLVADTYAQEKA